MDLMPVFVTTACYIAIFIMGIYAERMLFNVFAWAGFQNMRKGSKVGVAFVFFRNGQHEHKLIDFGKNTFDVQDRTYAIVSSRSGKMFNLPILVYPEDHALPADIKEGWTVKDLTEEMKPLDLSKDGSLPTDDPKHIQQHVKLAVLYMMTQQIKDFKRFQNLLLLFCAGALIFSFASVALTVMNGGPLNAINGKTDWLISAISNMTNATIGG